MKKIFTLLIALMLVLAVSVPALATNSTGGSTIITANVEDSYVVQIPATTAIVFNTPSTSLTPIKLTTAHLAPGKCVHVSATHTPLTMNGTGNEGNTIAYTLKSGDGEFVQVLLTNTTQETPLSIVIEQAAWDDAQSGSYTSTITFTYSYQNIT